MSRSSKRRESFRQRNEQHRKTLRLINNIRKNAHGDPDKYWAHLNKFLAGDKSVADDVREEDKE